MGRDDVEKAESVDPFRVSADETQLKNCSQTALAHVGDAVYELLVRTYLTLSGDRTASRLHRDKLSYVRAEAQAEIFEKIFPILTPEEQEICRRGRNTHVRSLPKSVSPADYHAATALETLFGWLYLTGSRERIGKLFQFVTDTVSET